jgi:hypothetical protein
VSLTGDTIVLSFISRQVGERYQADMQALSGRIGWALAVNPQPNQGVILETARKLIEDKGWTAAKGPGIHVDRGEVEVRLATLPDEPAGGEVNAEFEARTGFRLVFVAAAPSALGPAKDEPSEVVEIPLERIRLTATMQSMALNPDKALKAVERARRMGKVSPPIKVRRLKDGYLLTDGLYRFQAARTLGWERIQAIVEG